MISANEHGFKQDCFKVDYIVSVDYTYNTGHILMEKHLEKFPCPKINRWSWADYRLPSWNFAGDSGLTAIFIATVLGGWPVIFTGLDRFAGGPRKYFWQSEQPYRGSPSHLDGQRVRNSDIAKKTAGSCVRAMSGPLVGLFPAWGGPGEVLPPYSSPADRRPPAVPIYVKAQRKCYLHPADAIMPGTVLPVTAEELKRIEKSVTLV